jgi:hypothetical protein
VRHQHLLFNVTVTQGGRAVDCLVRRMSGTNICGANQVGTRELRFGPTVAAET